MRHSKGHNRGCRVKAAVFFGTLAVLLAVSLAIPLRPAESVRERRELTKFPDFPADALNADKPLWGAGDCFQEMGPYFRGIDAWFSDTFPGRDEFLEMNKRVWDLYGIRTVEIHGEQKGGDEIPDTPFTGE